MSGRSGLRFDKVVVRLIAHLREALEDVVRARTTALISVTAPIRVPGKTAEAIVEKVRAVVGRRAGGRDVTTTIHENHVRIRLVTHRNARAPKVLGFVHNPDLDSRTLLDAADETLRLVRVARRRATPAAPASRTR